MSFEELCEKIDAYENKEALKEYAFYHPKKCTYCANHNCDFYIIYNDKKMKVCSHRGGVYFTEFNEQNMMYLKQFIEIKITSSNAAV